MFETRKMNSLNGYEIILASGSPRRMAFFKEMGLDFKNKVIPVNEDFPTGLNGIEIANHITRKKTVPFFDIVKEKQIIITADTIVWHKNMFMGKPKNVSEAKDMLIRLSNSTHKVITAVGFLQKQKLEIIHEVSKVTFRKISNLEIEKYIKSELPFDKSGGYGIQDSFGTINITHIEGSFTNVIGLPVAQVFEKINEIINQN